MSSHVIVEPDYDDNMPKDPAAIGPRAAHLETSAGHTQTCTPSLTGTRLVDSSVLNSLGWGLRTLDNDFVADMLKVTAVGRDGVVGVAGYRTDVISKPGRVPLW